MYLLSWQLVSFLALELDEQVLHLGETRQWFVKESAEANPGANYFCGILSALYSQGSGRHFSDFAPGEVAEFSVLVEAMCLSLSEHQWSHEELKNREAWSALRRLAVAILDSAGVWINLPKQPFWFPEVMEIWWDDYRALAGHSGK